MAFDVQGNRLASATSAFMSDSLVQGGPAQFDSGGQVCVSD